MKRFVEYVFIEVIHEIHYYWEFWCAIISPALIYRSDIVIFGPTICTKEIYNYVWIGRNDQRTCSTYPPNLLKHVPMPYSILLRLNLDIKLTYQLMWWTFRRFRVLQPMNSSTSAQALKLWMFADGGSLRDHMEEHAKIKWCWIVLNAIPCESYLNRLSCMRDMQPTIQRPRYTRKSTNVDEYKNFKY